MQSDVTTLACFVRFYLDTEMQYEPFAYWAYLSSADFCFKINFFEQFFWEFHQTNKRFHAVCKSTCISRQKVRLKEIVQAFLSSDDFFKKKKTILSGITSECQTDLIQIRPDVLSGLIWVQPVYKSYQQTPLGDEKLRCYFTLTLKNATLTFSLLWANFNVCWYLLEIDWTQIMPEKGRA